MAVELRKRKPFEEGLQLPLLLSWRLCKWWSKRKLLDFADSACRPSSDPGLPLTALLWSRR